jgi:hypothetical protein
MPRETLEGMKMIKALDFIIPVLAALRPKGDSLGTVVS